MSDKTCATCRSWRKTDFMLEKSGEVGGGRWYVGYCEPPHTMRWKGLTDEDYSCGEHDDIKASTESAP